MARAAESRETPHTPAGGGRAPEGRRSFARDALLAALLLAAAVVAYIPAMRSGFIWDDDDYVYANPTLAAPDGWLRLWSPGETPQYYPLVFTTFWVEAQVWGADHAFGFHVVNVLLHALSAILVWCILTRINVPGAWLAAAVFALHPVCVESVAWITERKNVLSGFCYFAALLSFLRFEDAGKWRWYAVALALFVLALLSKTVTCTLPVAILIIRWWRRRPIDRRTIAAVAPMFLIGAALAIITVWVEKTHVGAEGVDWHVTVPQKIILAGRALWFYAGKIVWPENLIFIYPRWTLNAASVVQWFWPIAAVAVLAVAIALRKRIGRGPAAAMLFFGVTLGPALGFIQVYPMRYSYVADHFQYLASLGVIVLVVAVLARIAARWPKPAQAMPAVALLGVLGFLTWRQCAAYKDVETLWTETLARNDDAWIAHNNIGVLLDQRGDIEPAEKHYRRSLELKPDNYEAMNNLGLILTTRGRPQEAITWYQKVLAARPDAKQTQLNLGMALLNAGKPAEAAACFQRVIDESPNAAQAYDGLGQALVQMERREAAEIVFRKALDLDPNNARVLSNLGLLLYQMGRSDDAIPPLERAVAISPGDVQARLNLGIILTRTRRYADAIRVLQEGVQQNAPNQYLCMNLAWLLATAPDARLRDGQTAVNLAMQACQLTAFESARPIDVLAAAYAEVGRFEDAVKMAERAQNLIGPARTPYAAELAARLAFFRGGRAYRLPPASPAGGGEMSNHSGPRTEN